MRRDFRTGGPILGRRYVEAPTGLWCRLAALWRSLWG
jgi:hypothetical protein